MAKTLGELESYLLQTLQSKGKNFFRLKDACHITGTSYDATRLLVSKLAQKGWLMRIKKGKYLVLSLQEKAGAIKDWYAIAAALAEPHPYYLSHYTALALRNMTTQPVLSVFISSPKRIPDRILSNVKFKFIYCKPNKFWGIEDQWLNKQEKIKISDLERTVIDALSRPDLCGGISEIAKAIWFKKKEIDCSKLLDYAKRLGIGSVSKRIGFLLDLYQLASKSLCGKFKIKDNSFPLLDPTLPRRGFYANEWKLFINSPPEELKKIVWT
ncbi:MAG: type IV toxin-antitoxin system AbiEi family antitoxin domain-containing protein [Candidatus Margulisbacteria bacterium]|nr:type IV toxin-antitoxin system AbiEi family antitoxin domain-containing protein [Candidatus Margulisiibacteriota bacterium]